MSGHSNTAAHFHGNVSWAGIHAGLFRTTRSRAFEKYFSEIRQRQPILGNLADAPALLARLHDPAGSAADKNAILAVLVNEAQGEDSKSDVALTLVLLAVWPGLEAVYHRLRSCFRQGPDRLAGEVSGRASAQIRNLNLDRVSRIAATIVRNVERDIRRALVAEAAHGAVQVDIDQVADITVDSREATEAALLIGDLRRNDGLAADLRLIETIALGGYSARELAEVFKFSPEVSRKRLERARFRCRQALEAEISA